MFSFAKAELSLDFDAEGQGGKKLKSNRFRSNEKEGREKKGEDTKKRKIL